MSNLSQIKADSNWGDASNTINTNFQNMDVEVEKLKNSTTRFKGYFTNETNLKNKYPSPKRGDIAFVGEPYPGNVYDVLTDGSWHNTSKAPETGSVDLQDYVTKDDFEASLQEQDDKLTELDTKIDKRTTEYNVSVNNPTSGTDESNKYDLSTAIGQVPAELRTGGLTISFLNESGDTEKWEFSGGSWAVGNFSQVGAKKMAEIGEKVNIIEGIAITGEKEYSQINVDINSEGGSAWYGNRAYPDVSSASGIKINARSNGDIVLCALNKSEKKIKEITTINVEKGIGEYLFKTINVNINNECLYVKSKSGVILQQVTSELPYPSIDENNFTVNYGFKGDVLAQLITFPNIGQEFEQIKDDIEKIKIESDKIPFINSDITELRYKTEVGVIENGKCGDFDISSKSITEGTNRYYKTISLLYSKKLTINFSSSSKKDIVFFKGDSFVFYAVSNIEKCELNLEPIIRFLGADRAYVISSIEISDEDIVIDGVIKNKSVNEVNSGNLFSDEYVVCKGKAREDLLGVNIYDYQTLILSYIESNKTIYHNKYTGWWLYNSEFSFVSKGSGQSDINIETGGCNYILYIKNIETPFIVSYNKELSESTSEVPNVITDILTQSLDPTIYKVLSNTALIKVLKNYITDKYTGKSVFFVGNSYAQGAGAQYGEEKFAYPNQFQIKHPMADTQLGGAYIYSGRTISTFTSDNILKSVLNICANNGFNTSELKYPLNESESILYEESILLEGFTEIDGFVGKFQNGGQMYVYSINKETYEQTELYTSGLQSNVIEYTFKNKIKAIEGECIGLKFRGKFAYKADGVSSFKKIDGTSVVGSPLLQVRLNKCDYLIMEGGLNDMYNQGEDPETKVPFGTLLDIDDYTTDTFDDRTFCGALEHMIREAVFKLPATKLGFLIMPQPGDDTWNNKYAKAIRDVCDKYGVPYLDMGNLKRMKIVSLDSEPSRLFWGYNADGTLNYHPSAIGYNVMMNDAINAFIDSL